MPQVTVYIREHDLAKWKSIEKKTQFISNALNKIVEPEKSVPRAQEDVKVPGVTTADKIKPITYKKKGSWGA